MRDQTSAKNEGSVSLNKYISQKGICSRREADAWIEEGRVQINGEVAKKGNRVSPGDKVIVDGKAIGQDAAPVYLMFYKPPGVTSTTDRRDKSNIIDYIGFDQRIFPIGRLDKSSTGLILLTNDGDIVNQILRKENRHEKEYIVTVDRPITQTFIDKMSRPIPMLGTKTIPAKVKQLKSKIFSIVLTQGLNRQIRRMVEFCDYRVVTLKRIRVMDLTLGDLKPGQWRYLTEDELARLHERLE